MLEIPGLKRTAAVATATTTAAFVATAGFVAGITQIRSTTAGIHPPKEATVDASWLPSMPSMKETAVAATAATTAAITAPSIATAGLAAAGFTKAGVAAGSIAAGIQSGMGGYIAAGSLFSTCQSVGALGGFAVLGPVGLGAAAIAGVGTAAIVAYNKSQDSQKCCIKDGCQHGK